MFELRGLNLVALQISIAQKGGVGVFLHGRLGFLRSLACVACNCFDGSLGGSLTERTLRALKEHQMIRSLVRAYRCMWHKLCHHKLCWHIGYAQIRIQLTERITGL